VGSINEYQKGLGKLHPETAKIAEEPVKEVIDWTKLGTYLVVIALLGYAGYQYNQKDMIVATPPEAPIDREVFPEPVIELPEIVEKVETVTPKVIYKTKWKTKTVVKWRTKYKTKWKTRVKTVTGPTVIKYVKDPAYDRRVAELDAIYRRRLKLMQDFYNKPLKAGTKRTMTFTGSCPGTPIDNTIRNPQDIGLNVKSLQR
jgi:hypothetical protein